MELALPITVYWDLTSNTPNDSLLLSCCDQILECRPLMLQLYDPSPVLSEGALAVLGAFKGSGVSVSLTMPYSGLVSLDSTSMDEFGIKELLVAINSPLSLLSIPLIPKLGLAFFVSSDNWHALPDVVLLCRNQEINRLVLPMQRLYLGEEPFLLTKVEQRILENNLAVIGGTSDLRLTIHDPFLWRAFNPGIPFPQAGCQAANTMISISPVGDVFPCPTLPELLGNIRSTSLKDIITSPAKRELRKKITKSPIACNSCLEIAVCRGGCRGRSLVKYGSFDDVDDACR